MCICRYREYTKPAPIAPDSAWARFVTLRDALMARGMLKFAASRQAFATVTAAGAA